MSDSSQKSSPIIIVVIILAVIALLAWYFSDQQAEEQASTPALEQTVSAPEENQFNEPELQAKPEQTASQKIDTVAEPDDELVDIMAEPETPTTEQPIVPSLPALDQSDALVQHKFTELTWRKELLKLLVNDDMIRRFVVFTENFARGNLAYEHSPLVKPKTNFYATDENKLDSKGQALWQWDEKQARRFSLYLDLLRSLDKETLVNFYVEVKPLVQQAYQELGYQDQDFTPVLQQAIARVLDMEIPKQTPQLVRPSVMYKYQDPQIEKLADADKLLLRIGRENLLILKSVLLEISDKLARAQ